MLIGGSPVGSVDDVKLTDNGQAEVTISVDRELHEGTAAVDPRDVPLRNRQPLHLAQPGPGQRAGARRERRSSPQVDTTSPVDLDQLFNTLRDPERKGLQDIIQGSATVYAGRARGGQRDLQVPEPVPGRDGPAAPGARPRRAGPHRLPRQRLAASSPRLAERRDDLSGLTSNANEALGAIASAERSFDRALVALPPALRQANTTFFNLRATLDDLDPFVATAKPATKNLAPFLRQLKPVVERSVPVFADLRRAVNLKGKNNDLADAFGKLPAVEQPRRAALAGPAVQAMADSIPTLTLHPALLAGPARRASATSARSPAYYDADGHYARVQPAGIGLFHYNPGTPNLEPLPPAADRSPTTGPSAASSQLQGTSAAARAAPPSPSPTRPTRSSTRRSVASGAPPVRRAAGDCNATDVPPDHEADRSS